MKKAILIRTLAVIVVIGLGASTWYAFNLMSNYKSKYENQVKLNDRLIEENKKFADSEKKNSEELDEQKKLVADLEKKNKELAEKEVAVETEPATVAEVPEVISDYQSEADKQWIAEMSEANKEKVAQEQAQAHEPVYATYESEAGYLRFTVRNGVTVDGILALNGLSSVDQLVDGQSYRVK